MGGFSSVYPLLKAMEDSGLVRRGYFVDGLERRSSLCGLKMLMEPSVVS